MDRNRAHIEPQSLIEHPDLSWISETSLSALQLGALIDDPLRKSTLGIEPSAQIADPIDMFAG